MAELGFIGLGNMGRPMALRLLDAGHTLHVHDPAEPAVAILEQRGAKRADSARAVADAADIVLCSLPSPAILQQVVRDGVAHGARATVVIDLSTTGPRTTMAVADALAGTKLAYVDCPVSGGVPGAERGTLALMVSCPKPLFETVAPVLSTFGKLFHVGERPGQAQTLKLANNLLSAAAMAVGSEVMVMGVKAGLDPQMMVDVINVSSGANAAIRDKFPGSVMPRSFDWGFSTGLCFKDVRLCLDEAEAMGVPMVVGSAVRQFLSLANSVYGPDSDFTEMVKLVEGWAGATVDGRHTSGG